jgi:hypothetical protein
MIETRSVDQQATAHMTAFMKHKTCQQCQSQPSAVTRSDASGFITALCRSCAGELDHLRALASRRARS